MRQTKEARDWGIAESPDQARTYLRHEAGNSFDAARVDAFLTKGLSPQGRALALAAMQEEELDLVMLTFLVYNNLINLGQSWIFGGRISFAGLLLLLHGGVLLLGLAWLAKRNANWTFRSVLHSSRLAVKPAGHSGKAAS